MRHIEIALRSAGRVPPKERALIEAMAVPFRGGSQFERLRLLDAVIASWPEDGKSAAEILACADRCLYEAKARGRDQVVVNTSRAPRSASERDLDATHAGPPDPDIDGDVLTSAAPLVPPDR